MTRTLSRSTEILLVSFIICSQISDLLIISIYSDGSGSISFKEMSSHLSEAGYTEDVIQKIFKKMDTNKDNEISKEEFRNGFKMIAGLKSAPGK